MDYLSTPWQRALFLCGSLALIVGILYWAQTILIPFALAVLLAYILSPVVTFLQRRGLRRGVAVALVTVTTCAVVAALGVGLLFQIKELLTDLPQHKDRILDKLAVLTEMHQGAWFDGVRELITDITDRLEGRDAAMPREPIPVEIQESGLLPVLQSVSGPAIHGGIKSLLVLILVVFMLIRREDLRNRLIRLWGQGHVGRTTQALDDASRRISRFLLAQLMLNLFFGVVFGAALFFIGVPYALLWGALSTVLRYIPYLGVWVAVALPFLLSVAILPTWTQPILVLVSALILDIIVSQALEPLVFGQSIGVSEVALLVAAAFWAWLWGPLGLILATPMTACLVVLGRHVPPLEFITILLGDAPALDDSLRYFQRLLAKDQEEAAALVDDYLRQHPRERLFEEVLLPALVFSKRSRADGDLSDVDAAFIYRFTRDLMDDLELSAPSAPNENGTENAHAEPSFDGEEAESVLILGCPAKDEEDELALQLFRLLLDGRKCRFVVLSSNLLTAEIVAQVQDQEPAIVCIASLPPHGTTQARYLCKRLRSQSHDLKILVGCWGFQSKNADMADRLMAAGADVVGTSLVESRGQLLPLLSVATLDTERELVNAV